MVEPVTRRRVVGVLAAAGAAVAAPVSAAGCPTPIARLMEEREVALVAKDAAYDAENEVVGRLNQLATDWPADLVLSGLDLFNLQVPPEILERMVTIGEGWKHVLDVDGWREWSATPSWLIRARPEAIADVKRRLGRAERRDADYQLALERSGREELGAASAAAYERVADLDDAIIAAPATCNSDLASKAAVLMRQLDEGEPDTDDLCNVLSDVIALANSSAPSL